MAISESIIKNFMDRESHSPYCGDWECSKMPRTKFNGEQFICGHCGWSSEFPKEFIKRWKEGWDIK